jgi:hypothetical protein
MVSKRRVMKAVSNDGRKPTVLKYPHFAHRAVLKCKGDGP